MAGHSKWANIKFRKAGQDAKRGKVFTKLIREITVAAKAQGEDPSSNPKLRTAIDKALTANMTRDVINRAISRASGQDADESLEALRYEGYAPGGIAIMVDCLTNNKNRTVGEVRSTLNKYGGNLGNSGSVSYLFEEQGQISLKFSESLSELTQEQQTHCQDILLEFAIEVGANDVQWLWLEDKCLLITMVENLHQVRQSCDDDLAALEQKLAKALAAPKLKVQLQLAELQYVPELLVPLQPDQEASLLKLLDALDDLDDVQNLYCNADFGN